MLIIFYIYHHSPSYPCDMVTVLHLVLYKTADLDFTTRERATHLLQILDKRFVKPQVLSTVWMVQILTRTVKKIGKGFCFSSKFSGKSFRSPNALCV